MSSAAPITGAAELLSELWAPVVLITLMEIVTSDCFGGSSVAQTVEPCQMYPASIGRYRDVNESGLPYQSGV